MAPQVSIIMSVFNGASYLGESVDSILSQHFKDFEFIIIDDGSTDRTPQLLSSYDDSRIRLITNEENIGLAASLNRGMNEAEGEYVARIDSDDTCLPTRLQEQIEFLDANPAITIVGSWMNMVDHSNKIIELRRGRIESFGHFFFSLLQNRNWLYHPTVMFRRKPIIEAGGYDESLAVVQDRDLWFRLAMSNHHAHVIEKPLVNYRIHDNQASEMHREQGKEVKDRVHMNMLSEYLDANAVPPACSFFLCDREFINSATIEDTESLAANLELMLQTIAAKTGMNEAALSELAERIGTHAYYATLAMIQTSQRKAAAPLLRFSQAHTHGIRRMRRKVGYFITYLGLLKPSLADWNRS